MYIRHSGRQSEVIFEKVWRKKYNVVMLLRRSLGDASQPQHIMADRIRN
jgi:hypothetical protein